MKCVSLNRPANWSVNPFPFTDVNQITTIRFWFDSTDPRSAGRRHDHGGSGAYQNFGQFTTDLTLGGLSTLRIEMEGDVPDAGTHTVPEPTTVALLGSGLLGLAARRRHKNRS